MILIGYKNTQITPEELPRVLCPSCMKPGLTKHVSYFSITFFFVSIFRYRKLRVICNHCKTLLKRSKIPFEVSNTVSETERKERPLGFISLVIGLGVAIGLFYCFISYLQWSEYQQNMEYFSSPMEGDYYLLKQGHGVAESRYRILRLEETDGNQLSFSVGKFLYEYSSNASSAVSDGQAIDNDYYLPEPKHYSPETVEEMLEADQFSKIIRLP